MEKLMNYEKPKSGDFFCSKFLSFLVKFNMENRFEKCCFDYDLIRVTTQCDCLNCEVKHDPPFNFFFKKIMMNIVIVSIAIN